MQARDRSRTPSSPEQAPAAPAQAGRKSGLGNSFLAGRLSAQPTFEDGTPVPSQRGPEVTDSFDPRHRPASVKVGQMGALVGRGSEVLLRTGKTTRSRELARVPDGSPAEVVTVDNTRIQVRVRVGQKNVTGWADAADFTTQPGVSRDEDNKALADDYAYSYFGGDHRPTAPKGTDTAQGALGDCFFIASMAAIANASPQAIKDAIQFDARSGKYTVRFYEETQSGMKPVYITVDSYLPTEKGNRKDPAYAGDPGGPLWPAIMEKAYAQWKGGYDVIGEGGTGDTAMAEISGVRSRSRNPASMRPDEVLPYFQKAQKDGLAIYAGVRNTLKMAAQSPLSGSGSGPYRGTLQQAHSWNEVEPGTLSVTDKGGKVGSARDDGEEGDKSAAILGRDVQSGSIDYQSHQVQVQYRSGRSPANAKDLVVEFEYHGMLNSQKTIIGNHAYAFERVVNGNMLQFYNPWGSYQPSPITAQEFLQYFDSLSTNAVPKNKTAG